MFGKYFAEITREAQKWIFLAALCGMLFACANIALAGMVGVAVDQALAGKIALGSFLTGFGVLIVLRAIVYGLVTRFSQQATFQVRLGARDRIYKHLRNLHAALCRTGKRN